MPKKRNPSKGTVAIGQIIDGIMGELNAAGAPELMRVWQLWEQIVGEAVAQHTKPAAIKGDILLVYVSSSVWTHQLQFFKKELIENLNQALGKPSVVEDIKFKVGPV